MSVEMTTAPTLCVEAVEGCEQCAAESAYRASQGHECGASWKGLRTTCAVFGDMKRRSPGFHKITHKPVCCQFCKIVLHDRVSPARELTRLCRAGLCTEWYCPQCKRTQASTGPVDCPACGSLRDPGLARIRALYRRRRRHW